jgi:hypothetical protein
MSTQPPSILSPNETTTPNPKLDAYIEEIKRYGVDPTRLTVLFLSGSDSVIGEIQYGQERPFLKLLDPHRSIVLKNPRRLTRVAMRAADGRIGYELRFSGLDFMNEGAVEFVPTAGFMLDWCDDRTKIAYLNVYIGFFEDQKIQKAKEAGITIPT